MRSSATFNTAGFGAVSFSMTAPSLPNEESLRYFQFCGLNRDLHRRFFRTIQCYTNGSSPKGLGSENLLQLNVEHLSTAAKPSYYT